MDSYSAWGHTAYYWVGAVIIMSFFVVTVKGWHAPRWPTPLLTGVLRYLGCLLPGLNGHIVLLPAAALQTSRSSTHTCQAMSLACWVLRLSRAPLLHTWLLNPCTPLQAHIHTPKSSHKWTNKHVRLCMRHVGTIEFLINTEHTLSHSHSQTLLETHVPPLAYAKVIFSV